VEKELPIDKPVTNLYRVTPTIRYLKANDIAMPPFARDLIALAPAGKSLLEGRCCCAFAFLF
jgi:hypothetical protein